MLFWRIQNRTAQIAIKKKRTSSYNYWNSRKVKGSHKIETTSNERCKYILK
jgi:hypothetical protein